MDKKTAEIILRNVDRLIELQNTSRNRIEQEIGRSKGSISRMVKRPEDLTCDFAFLLAKSLDVSLDYLLYDAEGYTTDEKEVVEFFEKIRSLAMKDDLKWEGRDRVWIENRDEDETRGPLECHAAFCPEVDDQYDIYPKWLADILIKSALSEYEDYSWICGRSLGKGKLLDGITYDMGRITGPFYWAQLDSKDSSLYLYRVRYESSVHKKEYPKDVYEAYLQLGELPQYLGSSLDGEYLQKMIPEIYQIAEDSLSEGRLRNEARSFLREFNAAHDGGRKE